MNDVNFNSISFIDSKPENGFYFYNSAIDSDYGHIFGVRGLTLPKAMAIMKAKGQDPINNFKMNIACYYGP